MIRHRTTQVTLLFIIHSEWRFLLIAKFCSPSAWVCSFRWSLRWNCSFCPDSFARRLRLHKKSLQSAINTCFIQTFISFLRFTTKKCTLESSAFRHLIDLYFCSLLASKFGPIEQFWSSKGDMEWTYHHHLIIWFMKYWEYPQVYLESIIDNNSERFLLQEYEEFLPISIWDYHCSTQVQSGSMHSAPADVGEV